MSAACLPDCSSELRALFVVHPCITLACVKHY